MAPRGRGSDSGVLDVTTAKNIFAAMMLALTPMAAAAGPVDIAPVGETTVEVEIALLEALGLGGAPTGTATADLLPDPGSPTSVLFAFDITGGQIFDDGNAIIEHDGSGVRLFAAADTTIGAEVGNFVIDTELATVFGNVNGGAASVDLFNFGTPGAEGIPLLISENLATALGSVFGANPADLEGAQFALANTAPTPVPLPAGLPLLAAGLGALLFVRRRA